MFVTLILSNREQIENRDMYETTKEQKKPKHILQRTSRQKFKHYLLRYAFFHCDISIKHHLGIMAFYLGNSLFKVQHKPISVLSLD